MGIAHREMADNTIFRTAKILKLIAIKALSYFPDLKKNPKLPG